jgi:hypothetical protein
VGHATEGGSYWDSDRDAHGRRVCAGHLLNGHYDHLRHDGAPRNHCANSRAGHTTFIALTRY